MKLMMKKKTLASKPKMKEEDYSEKEKGLIRENQVLKSLFNLKDEAFFRQRLLIGIERIALALEESLENSEEEEEEAEEVPLPEED